MGAAAGQVSKESPRDNLRAQTSVKHQQWFLNAPIVALQYCKWPMRYTDEMVFKLFDTDMWDGPPHSAADVYGVVGMKRYFASS